MDQASAWLAASCARNPAVPKTSPSWRLSEDQSQIVVPPRDGLAPQSEPHSEPVHIAPRPSPPPSANPTQRAICCRIFTPAALPESPAASVRDYCSGAYRFEPMEWISHISKSKLCLRGFP